MFSFVCLWLLLLLLKAHVWCIPSGEDKDSVLRALLALCDACGNHSISKKISVSCHLLQTSVNRVLGLRPHNKPNTDKNNNIIVWVRNCQGCSTPKTCAVCATPLCFQCAQKCGICGSQYESERSTCGAAVCGRCWRDAPRAIAEQKQRHTYACKCDFAESSLPL